MAKEYSSIADILKDVNKKYNDTVLTVGVEDLTGYGTLSLGSPGFDFCLYNSFPERRIIEFTGGEGAGKTTTAYLVAASYQRKERERNPEKPRGILFIDLECGADPLWSIKMGYDMNAQDVKTYRFTGSDMCAEDIFDIALNMLKTGEIGLILLDSINMLVPQQVFDESLTKKDMGGIAKPLGDFVRRIKGLLIKYNCTLIGINQLRENIGGYGNPLTTSGGRGWKHGCDVRMMFKKSSFFDDEGNERLISAFETVLKGKKSELSIIFDYSVISMKKRNVQENVLISLEIDNNIKYASIYKSDENIIWAMDEEDAIFGLESFNDCKKNGCFFPAEFIRLKILKNKNVDDMYCEMNNFICYEHGLKTGAIDSNDIPAIRILEKNGDIYIR